ncbi:fluoride efflux transporter CrcB [Nocardia callitridis]|uniref:Fluoride-specific ion channel FluC n=1 Tax=Nocardia callitridis TaxID=648753 RepID=A0ABP9KNV2_9NOCA
MTELSATDPTDPDVDLRIPDQRRELFREHRAVLAVVALGGGLGALGRYGITQAMPTAPGHFPWATFCTNLSGCFAIGILMVLVTEVWSAHRLIRPFLGTGLLGGFTTFSTYTVEIHDLLRPGAAITGLVYLFATLLGALVAVFLGVTCARITFLRKKIRRVQR